MARALKLVGYLTFPGLFGYALMQIAKPSEVELQQIKAFTPKKNKQFSDVLQAAANPSAKPMYQQKPGQQHPLPELAQEAQNSR